MNIFSYQSISKEEAVRFFKNVFTDAYNVEEGEMVSGLVDNLMSSTRASDLLGFVAKESDKLIGCIFFSKMRFQQPLESFILSPVAVDTQSQGKGIGQRLINYGLDQLKTQGVKLVFTYGDPNYYSKVGFQPITEDIIQAPHPLSQSEGWLCQSMDGSAITPVAGRPQCVDAFNDPNCW